jgi:hypothetical protein
LGLKKIKKNKMTNFLLNIINITFLSLGLYFPYKLKVSHNLLILIGGQMANNIKTDWSEFNFDMNEDDLTIQQETNDKVSEMKFERKKFSHPTKWISPNYGYKVGGFING